MYKYSRLFPATDISQPTATPPETVMATGHTGRPGPRDWATPSRPHYQSPAPWPGGAGLGPRHDQGGRREPREAPENSHGPGSNGTLKDCSPNQWFSGYPFDHPLHSSPSTRASEHACGFKGTASIGERRVRANLPCQAVRPGRGQDVAELRQASSKNSENREASFDWFPNIAHNS